MPIAIPEKLAAACQSERQRAEWLHRLPDVLTGLERRWSLKIGTPFEGPDVSCAWVARVIRKDGTAAVLKLGMPHFEGEHEIDGLRFWNGDPTVRLLKADHESGAMLLESCEPGTSLRELPETAQDEVIAGLLRKLWRVPSDPYCFRPLAAMTEFWSREVEEHAASWRDSGLVSAGLSLFRDLPKTAPEAVLLATDLHAGNVLRARREPWLVIDPKPFFGDPAYDATQHLLNCYDRLRSNPEGTIRRMAELSGLDYQRVRLWIFARAAVQSGAGPNNDRSLELARVIKI